ncbi:MAG: 4-alpha-glucanotransferase [Acidobacteria bacterium]|nr:4-alpha-glucanotransferase [Acidobacteriota bacterium]
MDLPRKSGILLHPTSLAGGHGVGDLGPEASRFVEFLSAAKQGLWQVLPLGPTGFGDSPYQCFSAFAGNPMLISLERLAEEGWVDQEWLSRGAFPDGFARYEAVQSFKVPLIREAAARFEATSSTSERMPFEQFCEKNKLWLDDFALFMAAKRLHGMLPWSEWDPALRDRKPEALARLRGQEAHAIFAVKFAQWTFFRQWARLRAECKARGVLIMGDMPIYAAWDSSDVWVGREYWELDPQGRVKLQAGVPPDYFSQTGQLWGHPVYRWDAMERSGFQWWIERFKASSELFDLVRLDHFRGFQAYWAVPGGHDTAQFGEWREGPGLRLFQRLEDVLGPLPVVAENLGVITPEVDAIRRKFGYPGMAVLQFAFSKDPQAKDFRPHNYLPGSVAYTGTHDNDTTLGWWHSDGMSDSTRSPEDLELERSLALTYLGLDGGEGIHWHFIRTVMASVARLAVVPAQDLLGLGTEARMNLPSKLGGNWVWRLKRGQLTPELAARMARMVELYDRV